MARIRHVAITNPFLTAEPMKRGFGHKEAGRCILPEKNYVLAGIEIDFSSRDGSVAWE